MHLAKTMAKKGTTGKVGRPRKTPVAKPIPESGPEPLKCVISKTLLTPPVKKSRFRGRLSHTSPVPQLDDPSPKITTYFLSNTSASTSVSYQNSGTSNKLKIKGVALPENEPRRVDISLSAVKEESTSDNDTKYLANREQAAEVLLSLSGNATPRKKELERVNNGHENNLLNCLTATSLSPSSALSHLRITRVESEEIKITAKPKARRKLKVDTHSAKPLVQQNHRLTEYFPVRRSERKPKTALLEEKQRSLEEAVLNGKEEGLKVHHFAGKGRGVVATRLFRRGEFALEYYGDLVDMEEAKLREKRYAVDQNTGCYMYYFQYKNQSYCIDATEESDRLGRLVNHSRSGNLATKVVEVQNKPRLVLVARKDIQPGEELLYDYGDRSKLSLMHHPWLAN